MRSRFRFCSCSDGALLGRGFKLANPVPVPPLAPARYGCRRRRDLFQRDAPREEGSVCWLLPLASCRAASRGNAGMCFFLTGCDSGPRRQPVALDQTSVRVSDARRRPRTSRSALNCGRRRRRPKTSALLPCREPPLRVRRCCNKKVFVKKVVVKVVYGHCGRILRKEC